MSNSKFLERDKIELNDSQTKMLISGWGKDVYEKTIVERITYLSDRLKSKRIHRLSQRDMKERNFPA